MSADPVPEVAAAYAVLCLRLRRMVPALVDARAADPALHRAVAAEPPAGAAALVREAGRLAATLPDAGLDPVRAAFFAAQLRAVEWRARRLAGQRVPFDREVRECLDLDAVLGEPDAYRAAHRELAALLPGSGPLGPRMAAHRDRDAVAPERLEAAVRALTEALRGRVAVRYGLPPGETVEVRVVDDAPWSALQVHTAGDRSVVRVNGGAGPTAGRLPRLVAHETYPGHHTECTRVAMGGRVELALTVAGTPQTVVSEGLAECALDTAVGPGWGAWAGTVLAGVGVGTDGALAEAVDTARAPLRRVRLDAALLLHRDGPPDAAATDAAHAHLQRWLLLDDRRARRVVDALARPLWRTQVVAAVEGAVLMGDRLVPAGADPVEEHLRLLDDPLTPSALRSRTSTERASILDGR